MLTNTIVSEKNTNFHLIKKTMNNSEYFRITREAKKQFYKTGIISPVVRKPIAEAWEKDKKNGHDPKREASLTLPSDDTVKELLDKNNYLISIGSNVINTICRTLNKIDFCLELFDSTGHLLYLNDRFNPKNVWKPIPSTQIGVNFCDNNATTTSISLALNYQQDFSVYGPEHYCDLYDKVNCSASLIRGNSGEILGLLNIMYYSENMNTLLPSLAVIAANLIEQQIRYHTYQNILNFTFDDISECALIIDPHMKIKIANKSFLNMLGIDNGDIIGKDAKMLFKEIDFERLESSNKQKISITETMLHYDGKSYRLNANISLLRNKGLHEGYLILCREIQKIITLSQKYTSSAIVDFSKIITTDHEMEQLIKCCKNIAAYNIPVFLAGESGTGKDLFAQAIHNASPRKGKPFIAINCAALPMNLVESELFGYEKGAFTGALSTGKAGKFEQADGGTIFLDEIGELPLDIQSKLLRVLDNHKITRIGGKTEIDLNIRLISATNRNLEDEIMHNNFREDLYYRLNVMSFHIPPLRERHGDIKALAEYFLSIMNAENNELKSFSADAIEKMNLYSWNGNVRELQNTVIRAYYLCESEGSNIIRSAHITMRKMPSHTSNIADTQQTEIMSLKNAERQMIEQALKSCEGNVKEAANILEIPLSTIYKRMKQYDIKIKTY